MDGAGFESAAMKGLRANGFGNSIKAKPQGLKPTFSALLYVVAEATTHKAKRARKMPPLHTKDPRARIYRPAKGSAVTSSGISMWIWVPWPSWLRMSILN